MTRDVKTCSEDDTIEGLMGRMTTGKFRHMPVVDQGKLIGIVSIGDVVKNRVEEIEHKIRSATRLHPPVIRSMDYTHRSGSLPDRDGRPVTDISRSPRHVCFTR